MFYIIKMMSGDQYRVTDSEYQIILKAKGTKSDVFIPRLMSSINPASISNTYPENIADEIEQRREQKTGVLHDGTRVKRLFGEWVDADNTVPDDNGKYVSVRLDPHYYPEVAADCVPTEIEFDQLRGLSSSDRLTEIMKKSNRRPSLEAGETREPQALSDILKNTKK